MNDQRILLREETERILQHLQSRLRKEGTTELSIVSYWQGELRWARNEANLTSDRRDIRIGIKRVIRGGDGSVTTNQLDPESLDSIVRRAEELAIEDADQRGLDMPLPENTPVAMQTSAWSDTTFGRTPEQNSAIVQHVTERARAKQLLSSGYLEARGFSYATLRIDDYGRMQSFYGQLTQGQCSVTVRHPKGTGSGWAGLSGYDFAKLDERAIGERALDKCLRSLDPVRIEPGRYTAILEAQATASLLDLLVRAADRARTEYFARPPFWFAFDEAIDRHRSKLGQKVIDSRITIEHDPSDPELGMLPIPGVKPITYVKDGVLQALTGRRPYFLRELVYNEADEARGGVRMSGGTTSVDEMIASTKRGLLVARLIVDSTVDEHSFLFSGVTRDGLWLVENGKITKAVRNFRWTESPLFVLNNVVDLGVPVPVFRPQQFPDRVLDTPEMAITPMIVPALRVNDFSFTSTIDAV